jgi:ABC-2 type transport system ATP-binding protein
MNVIECAGLAKRYGSVWALRECTLAIPEGQVVALVGPNGAGKTTLLHLVVGLGAPSAGRIAVVGAPPGSAAALRAVAFVAQDAPLYKNLPVGDMLHLTYCMNGRWDQRRALARLDDLGIPRHRRVGELSGGQQAQLALSLALARGPRLLVLDEPLATLDPVARHDFMATVMTAVADEGLSVVLSSHVLAELSRVADYLVVLAQGRVQLAGTVEDLLSEHAVLMGPAAQADDLVSQLPVVRVMRSDFQALVMVRADPERATVPPGWEAHRVGLEELAMAYLRAPDASALPGPAASHRRLGRGLSA